MARRQPGSISAAIIAAACIVVLNEWTVAALFAPDGQLNFESASVVRAFDLVLLVWLVVAARRGNTVRIATLAYLGFVAVAVVGTTEAVLALALRFPASRLAAPLRPVLRDLYPHWMKMIQFDPECSRFDPELSYTLRPGSCDFSNFEFTTRVEVNSAGLRDDEASLDAPEIIVLGDSVAMGWGVAQNETFTELLQRATGRRALNAGISSYGTAREMALLRRLDTSNLRALVIQYCDNDLAENRAFLEAGNKLHVIAEHDREGIVAFHHAETAYRPGAYVRQAVRNAAVAGARSLSEWIRGPASWRADRQQQQASDDAEVFLRVLASLPPPSTREVRILAFDGCVPAGGSSGFARRLARLNSLTPPATLTVVQPDLGPDDHFTLDAHPNASGHARITQALVDALGPRGP